MRASAIGRGISIAGGVILLVSVSIPLILYFVLGWIVLGSIPSIEEAPIVFMVLIANGAIINIICSLIMIVSKSRVASLVAGSIGMITSTIFFGGIIGVVGGILGIVGGALNFNARATIEISFGCIILYVSSFCLGLFRLNFVTTVALIFVGTLILIFGTFDLRRKIRPPLWGDITSILILLFFWAIYSSVNHYLYDLAIENNILRTWQTLPWLFLICLNVVLPSFLVLNYILKNTAS